MTVKARLQMVVVIVAALLLAMLLGIMVTRASADSPVMWKQFCPTAHADIELVKDGDGTTVLCVRAAERRDDDSR